VSQLVGWFVVRIKPTVFALAGSHPGSKKAGASSIWKESVNRARPKNGKSSSS